MKRSSAKQLQKSARAADVAHELVEGRPLNQIARRKGVSVKTIERDIAQGETRTLVHDLLGIRRDSLARLLDRSLKVIEHALEADKVEFVESEGTGERCWVEIEGVPDHSIRLQAVDRLQRLVSLGSQPDSNASTEVTFTWEQLEHEIERRGRPEPPSPRPSTTTGSKPVKTARRR